MVRLSISFLNNILLFRNSFNATQIMPNKIDPNPNKARIKDFLGETGRYDDSPLSINLLSGTKNLAPKQSPLFFEEERNKYYF